MQESKRSMRPWVMLGLVGLVVWWLAISPPAAPDPVVSLPSSAAGSAGEIVPADPSKPAAQPAPLTGGQEPPSRAQEQHEEKPSEALVSAPVPVRQGPLDDLTKRYAGESRGEGSDKEEARVRAAFSDPAIPAAMLHSVECRRTVCRTELRWKPEHDAAYVLGLTRAVGSFKLPVGIEGAGAPDREGARPLVVYFGWSR